MGRRSVLLALALLLAVAGGVLVWLYVNSIEQRAENDLDPVDVLVVTATVPAGQTGAQAEAAGAFVLQTLPGVAVADGALSSTEPVSELVALGPLFPGEQVLAQKFGQPGGVAALPIPEGKTAVSVQLPDPARVAGFVQPGSQVTILMTSEGLGGGTGNQAATRVLLPKVEVIAIGQTTLVTQTTQTGDEAVTENIPVSILTLALDQQEAQKVVFGQSRGELYFTLLDEEASSEDARVPVGPATTTDNLFGE